MVGLHPLQTGSYQEIARALPEHRSVVLVAGEADANELIDVICDLRGNPADLECRVQVARSIAETTQFLRLQGVGVTAFATEATRLAVLGRGFTRHGGVEVCGVDPIDRLADLVPEGGAVIVSAAQERRDLIGTRVIARRGNAIAKACRFLVSQSYEQEDRDLKGTDLPALYDPAFPKDRTKSRPALVDRYRTGRFAQPETATDRAFGGVPTSLTVWSPPTARKLSAEEIAADREQRLGRHFGAIRKLERIANRKLRRAEWASFIQALPARPHRILVSDLHHAHYVTQCLDWSGRRAELESLIEYRVLPVNGGDQVIPQTDGGIEAYHAPGLTVSLGRARIRTAMGNANREAGERTARAQSIAARQAHIVAEIQTAAAKSEEALRADFAREEERLRAEIVRLDGECNLLRVQVRDLIAEAARSPATAAPAPIPTGYPFGPMVFIADPAPHAAAPGVVGAPGFFGAGRIGQRPAVVVLSRLHPDDSDPSKRSLIARPAPGATVTAAALSDAFSAAPADTLGPYSKGRARC